jgi:hypothetical protein
MSCSVFWTFLNLYTFWVEQLARAIYAMRTIQNGHPAKVIFRSFLFPESASLDTLPIIDDVRSQNFGGQINQTTRTTELFVASKTIFIFDRKKKKCNFSTGSKNA